MVPLNAELPNQLSLTHSHFLGVEFLIIYLDTLFIYLHTKNIGYVRYFYYNTCFYLYRYKHHIFLFKQWGESENMEVSTGFHQGPACVKI